MSGLASEFALVAACCGWPPSERRDTASAAAAAAPVDWARVLRIARRQRVEGLVAASLKLAGVAPPPAQAEALRALARDIAGASLSRAAESVRLQAQMDAAGIANLALKGAAVEMLAYGALGLKNAWDIDFLVSAEAAERACEILDADGYERVEPRGVSPAQFRTWTGLAKECEFAHRRSGSRVELHWRLADGPALLAGVSVASPSQTVAVASGMSLRTLAREALFSHLCVHGAMHGWSRLKWLADLAAVLSQESPQGVEELYRSSLTLGAGLCSAQALLLCKDVLGADLPDALEAELRASARVRWLERVALATMTGGGAEKELEDRPFAASRVLFSELFLGGTWRAAAAQFGYRAVSLHDRVYIPLPPALHFLYPVLRVPLWLWRRLTG